MEIRHFHCVAILHPSGISTSNVKIAQKACVLEGILVQQNDKMEQQIAKMEQQNEKALHFSPLFATRQKNCLKDKKIFANVL